MSTTSRTTMLQQSILTVSLTVSLGFLLSSCSLLGGDDISTVLGTVIYYNGIEPGGGDLAGFMLKDYDWRENGPRFDHVGVYVVGAIDSTYLGHQIMVEGRVRKVEGGSFHRKTYAEVQVRSVRALH